MIRLPDPLYRLWRCRFGRVEIDDPRPIAESSPYTYFLPSENELLALAPGDLVRIVIRSIPASRKWGAERMWFSIVACEAATLTGTLDNVPDDIPQLRLGARLQFKRSDVIGIIWNEERAVAPPAAPPAREYWDRCLVDTCVVDQGVPVHFLYREAPEAEQEGDRFPDSGWRIRGDYRGLAQEEIDAREMEYIALGKVLNADDSWLHLIDMPTGSAFIRDWETGKFVPEDDS